eukprot:SAG22_NODE_476_length_9995_cov_9.488480_3_plen_235_part_00
MSEDIDTHVVGPECKPDRGEGARRAARAPLTCRGVSFRVPVESGGLLCPCPFVCVCVCPSRSCGSMRSCRRLAAEPTALCGRRSTRRRSAPQLPPATPGLKKPTTVCAEIHVNTAVPTLFTEAPRPAARCHELQGDDRAEEDLRRVPERDRRPADLPGDHVPAGDEQPRKHRAAAERAQGRQRRRHLPDLRIHGDRLARGEQGTGGGGNGEGFCGGGAGGSRRHFRVCSAPAGH